MEDLYEIVVTVVVPALVTALLGLAVPALNDLRKKVKASKNKLLIDILEATISTGFAYFKERAQKPTIEGVADYVKTSIPDTLAQINPKKGALEQKIIGEAGKLAINILKR